MVPFKPCGPELFFRRNDPTDPRLGEKVTIVGADSDLSSSTVIVGYPDDEGISLNGGRTGAAHGPDVIRKYLYKMTPDLFCQKLFELKDVGNLQTTIPLAERHEQAKNFVHRALKQEARVLSFGGGHDYGYSDGAGFLLRNLESSKKPLIINFDAHLDVRPLERGLTSGTPFYRLLKEFKDRFDFWQIGIQTQCNSQTHLDWCLKQNGHVIFQDEILLSGQTLVELVTRRLGDQIIPRRPCYISVDIDGFSSADAMGCSQSWPTGFRPQDFFPLFEVLLRRLHVQVLGIYEVSPPLDMDDRTAKLAAVIAHRFLFHPFRETSYGS